MYAIQELLLFWPVRLQENLSLPSWMIWPQMIGSRIMVAEAKEKAIQDALAQGSSRIGSGNRCYMSRTHGAGRKSPMPVGGKGLHMLASHQA